MKANHLFEWSNNSSLGLNSRPILHQCDKPAAAERDQRPQSDL